ncbi:MAG: T9SS type A sorting domain-containing protein, partial [Bacteroidota bacterium]
ECDGNAGQYTSFDASAVQPVYPCLGSLDIAFAEILVPNSCEAGGGKLKLQWTASTACGYTDTLEYVVDIIDNTPPYFLDYEPTLTLACGEAIPTLNASDNCGAVSLDIATETISGTCGHEETLYRTITATDACGLATTVNQTIHFVDTAGPQFELPNTTCQAAATTAVQAYDACMGANIAATLMSEEVVEVCSAYQLTERVWSATDDCGNTTNFVQHIYPDDFEVEYVVINPTLQMLIANGQSSISLSDETLMDALQAIDKLAVAGLDPCGRTLESSFEQHYLPMDDCEDGVVATMTYTWNFLALCGNTFAYHLYFEVVQDEIPAIDIAEELSIYCTTDLPELEILNQADGIDYTIQTEDFRNTDGDGIVLRTITATDICGNTAAAEQTIYAYNTTDLSCAIEGYFEPSCNSKNNVYAVAIDGGTAPYDVHWEVIGTGCIVAASYGNTAEIHIGFGLARIAAKVTDANGCVTTCEATVECQGIGQLHQLANDESEIETTTFRAFPNPFRETFTVVTDAPFNETAQLMIFNSLGQVVHQQVLYDPSTIIDASALPAGTYHVILEEQGRKQRVPIVKVEY